MRRAAQTCAIASTRPCRDLALGWHHHIPHLNTKHGSTLRARYAINHAHRGLARPTNTIYATLIGQNIDTDTGSAANVASLLQEMETNGLIPDSNVCHTSIRALAVHPDPYLVSAIIDFMRESWLPLTDGGWHDLVAGQIKSLRLEEAMENLEAMRSSAVQRLPWLLDMALFALCDRGEVDEALALMQNRLRDGEIGISRAAWYYFFEAVCIAQHYPAITFIWQHQVDVHRLNPSNGQCLAVLQTAAQRADVPLATAVFSVLGKRASSSPLASIHYELLMDTYLAVEDIRTPLTVLCIMSVAGVKSTRGTARNLYNTLVRGGPTRVTEATNILHELHEEHPTRPIPPAAMNAILEATIDAGVDPATVAMPNRSGPSKQPITPLDVGDDPEDADLKLALQRFEDLAPLCVNAGGPTRETYHLLMRRCAKAPVNKRAAVFLADEMVDRGFEADATTGKLLAAVCIEDSLGLSQALEVAARQEERDLESEETMRSDATESFEDAWRFYEEMRDQGWLPPRATMNLMLRACIERGDSRSEDLKEAMQQA